MAFKVYSRELLTKDKPKIAFPAGLRLRDHIRELRSVDGTIFEFIGSDSFSSEWNERRRYEVDAGRDEEPLLFGPIYDSINDASLPRNVPIFKIGPGAVALQEITDGGEVKFMTVGSSEDSVRMHHYATGLEYSKDLVAYNELWSVPLAERAVGIAYNALMNHIHLYPILSYAYAAANQTAAVTSGATTVEDYLLTIEAAITASKTDTSNPRRGPYVLLVSSADDMTVRKALKPEVQQGLQTQSDDVSAIRAVIAYDGWTGEIAGLPVSYSGVSSGTGYLISLQYKSKDFMSFIKQDLMQDGMQDDISRFLTQIVWDTYFTAYAAPLRAVEEITWPS